MILALNYANTRKFSVADIASFDGGQVADLHDQALIKILPREGFLT
ncbi:MAG: hypothetical protein U0T81_17365 [Saprospiraceae bacterium]